LQCDEVRTRWCIRPKNGAEKFISKAILERCPMRPSGPWTLCLCFVSCTAIPLSHVSHLPFVYPACHFFQLHRKTAHALSFSGSYAHASRPQSAFRAPLLRSNAVNAVPQRFSFIFGSQIISS
jgi:hypothetical protein